MTQRLPALPLLGVLLVAPAPIDGAPAAGAPAPPFRSTAPSLQSTAPPLQPTAPPQTSPAPTAPSYEIDPYWPQELPADWLLGNVVGVATDSQDNVWIIHRPNSQRGAEGTPPVIAFDPAGQVIQAWGGPGRRVRVGHADPRHLRRSPGPGLGRLRRRTSLRHHVAGHDRQRARAQVHAGRATSSSRSATSVGVRLAAEARASSDSRPTCSSIRPADEVYVSDGYTNRRVIVFDASTGEHRRHWGAYGNEAEDAPLPAFNADIAPLQAAVRHAALRRAVGRPARLRLRPRQRAAPGLPAGRHVRGRGGDRCPAPRWIRRRHAVGPGVLAGPGSAADLRGRRPASRRARLRRDTLEVVATMGRRGRWAGQFESPHSLAVDSRGNLFVGETLDGRRVQKFTPGREPELTDP